METYTGRQIRCGIGTDEQKWVAVEDVEREFNRSEDTLKQFIKQTKR